jgi:hypothetical protein
MLATDPSSGSQLSASLWLHASAHQCSFARGISYQSMLLYIVHQATCHRPVIVMQVCLIGNTYQSFATPSPVTTSLETSSGTENIGTFLTDELATCDGNSQGSFPSC